MVLSELRDNYWGAEIAYRLFEQADAKLHNRPEHHRNKAIVSDDSTGNIFGDQFTSLPLLTPVSNLLQTKQIVSEDYLFDTASLFSDEFARGSMFDTDSYIAFDMATMLETHDMGIGNSAGVQCRSE
jgi:hypothetical protein